MESSAILTHRLLKLLHSAWESWLLWSRNCKKMPKWVTVHILWTTLHLQLHERCCTCDSDSALCGSNMKALCLSFLRVSTNHAGYCASLCVTCWLLVLLFGCVRRCSACYWPPALRAWWSLQWLVVQFLYHSTVRCIFCAHQQSTSAVPCSCSCWYGV